MCWAIVVPQSHIHDLQHLHRMKSRTLPYDHDTLEMEIFGENVPGHIFWFDPAIEESPFHTHQSLELNLLILHLPIEIEQDQVQIHTYFHQLVV